MPQVRISGPRKLAGLLVASAALVLSVAACSGGSDSDASSSGGGANPDGGGNNQFAAYTECLQKNGVTITLPSGRARPSGGARPSDGAGRPSGFPSGMPRPSGSAGQRGGGGFPGGGMMNKPDNVSQETWDKAQAACASVLPSFGAGGGNRGGNGANAAYRNCLQQHGVTQGETPLDTTDPTVKKAEEACKVLRPTASASPTA